MTKNASRPNLSDIQTGEEFRKWYWLKEELVAFCKLAGISYAGTKFEMIDRIAEAFDVGVTTKKKAKAKKVTSKFDWHCEELTLETVITDSYKNSQNVGGFFKKIAVKNFISTSLLWLG
jgi:SAP domain-containing new25/Domain of unknown function (DUF6434)